MSAAPTSTEPGSLHTSSRPSMRGSLRLITGAGTPSLTLVQMPSFSAHDRKMRSLHRMVRSEDADRSEFSMNSRRMSDALSGSSAGNISAILPSAQPQVSMVTPESRLERRLSGKRFVAVSVFILYLFGTNGYVSGGHCGARRPSRRIS